jgi:hypothetical protein
MRKALQTGFVCLTAIMTLVAGFPHFACQCPNGNFKPFCLGLSTDGSGCCCGSACCSKAGEGGCCCCAQSAHSSRKEAETSGCCQEKSRQTAKAGAQNYESQNCTKTEAERPLFTGTIPSTTVGEDTTPGPFVAALPSLGCLARVVEPVGHHDWEIHLVAPPTDLVITLQHFLI